MKGRSYLSSWIRESIGTVHKKVKEKKKERKNGRKKEKEEKKRKNLN